MSGKLAVVDQASSVLQKVQDYIDAGMLSTVDVTEEMVEQEKGSEEKASSNCQNQVKAMKEVMMRYVKMDMELKNFVAATNHAKQFVLSEGGNLMQMEEELDRKLKSFNKEKNSSLKLQQHEKYKEFEEKINSLLNPEDEHVSSIPQQTERIDEDMEVTQDTVSTKCPYTGMEMTDPVKNKHCGHVYDRQGIADLCKKRSKPKCPIPGCVNQRPITMDDMIEDPAMKKMIKALTKKAQKGSRKK